jgi:hypothetical protein
MPGIAVSWTAMINDYPAPGARITTMIQQTADQSTMDAFTDALHQAGPDTGSLAYIMTIEMTGLNATGPATVIMTAPGDWVTRNGGIQSIMIGRMADDGTTEILSTSFDGYDSMNGYLTFTAISPQGLGNSVFGLIGVKPYTPVSAPVSGTIVPASGQAAPDQVPAPALPVASTGLPPVRTAGVIVVVVILGLAMLGIIWRNRKF